MAHLNPLTALLAASAALVIAGGIVVWFADRLLERAGEWATERLA